MVVMESEQKLKLGDRAPDFHLRGVDGRYYSLEDFRHARALLVVFTCNHCPYAQAKIPVMKELVEKYGGRGLVVVGINPNDPTSYPEDSFENMQMYALEGEYNFHYLQDETQEVARSYGAVCTPDPFLFDSDQKLVYHGRFDNALSPDAVPTVHDMDEAIALVLAGKPVDKGFLPSRGCSIKWK
jgi:peroxiredoxin